jgi:predicted AAA+ superfamily ATPase
MYITRKLEKRLFDNLKTREYLAVVGPRQSGKTTLLRNMFSGLQNAVFLSFEDRDMLGLFVEDIKSFIKKYENIRYIFIDEFQYAGKDGGKNLKYIYDTFPGIKIIISGSSALELTVSAVKYMVGRIFVFHLYPLDFEEYVSGRDPGLYRIYQQLRPAVPYLGRAQKFPPIAPALHSQFKKLLDEFITFGGYPRVALAESVEEKVLVLKSIYSTFFLREIRDVLGLIDDFKLARLIKIMALQIGQLIEYNGLGTQAEYDHITLKKYLSILEKTFVCNPVRPFFNNRRKEIVKNPKYYFLDTGLRNQAIGDFNAPDNRVDKGFLYENFIYTQLLKAELPVNFWRTTSKAEVDFVLAANRTPLPIEVKAELDGPQITRSLHSFLAQYRPEQAIYFNKRLAEKKRLDNVDIFFLPHWLA